eukprot:2901596-Rhodomonas_salina.3
MSQTPSSFMMLHQSQAPHHNTHGHTRCGLLLPRKLALTCDDKVVEPRQPRRARLGLQRDVQDQVEGVGQRRLEQDQHRMPEVIERREPERRLGVPDILAGVVHGLPAPKRPKLLVQAKRRQNQRENHQQARARLGRNRHARQQSVLKTRRRHPKSKKSAFKRSKQRSSPVSDCQNKVGSAT